MRAGPEKATGGHSLIAGVRQTSARGAAETFTPAEPDWRLYALIALMVMTWSLNFAVSKVALRDFPALMLALLRATLAAALLVPVCRLNGRKCAVQNARQALPAADLKRLIPLGIVGIGLNQVCFVLGISRTSVAHSSLIMAMTPMLVLVIASLRGQERFTLGRLAGMSIAACGVLTLNLAPSKPGAATLPGDLLTFGAALTFAFYTVCAKEFTTRHGAVTVNAIAYGSSAVAFLPLTAWTLWGFDFGKVSLAGWLSLIYMAVFPSVVAFLIYYHALTHLPASRVSSVTYFQPLLATLIALIMLGEPVTTSLGAGGALVVAGVWLAERGSGRGGRLRPPARNPRSQGTKDHGESGS